MFHMFLFWLLDLSSFELCFLSDFCFAIFVVVVTFRELKIGSDFLVCVRIVKSVTGTNANVDCATVGLPQQYRAD